MTPWIDSRMGFRITELTLGGVLARRAEAQGDKVYLTDLGSGISYTYRQIDELSNRLGQGLLARGLAKGDRVAIVMENCAEFLVCFFALGKCGAVVVPINTSLRGQSLRYILEQSGCRAAFVGREFVERVGEAAPGVLHDIWQVEGAESLQGLMAVGSGAVGAQVAFSDLACILYTSGTTGLPKGVTFTQARTLLWGLSHIEAFGYNGEDVYYVCLPLFHVNGLHGSTLNALLTGGSVALRGRFSASGFWRDIRASGATVTNLLGSMANILWAADPAPDDAENRLRMIQVNPVPAFARTFEKRFGMRFISGFGLTDFGASHAFSLNHRPDKLGSCGTVRRGIEARIVDVNDFDLPAGATGELVLRSDNPWESEAGYYGDPASTRAAWRNGWFHTGDRGFIDADGYLWFVDRTKDTIRRRGENISAFEVEQVILAHPAVADVAVFPVKSDLSEEEVAAAVMLRAGANVAPDEIARFCAGNLAHFMVPRYLRFVADLPRNASQKVEKFRLRGEAEAALGVFWDRERSGLVLGR